MPDPKTSNRHIDEHRLRRLLEGDGSAASLFFRTALFIPGKLYGAAMALRRRAYDADIFQSSHAGLPTVSVGNLTAGGSGKTPTVAALAKLLAAAGHRPAILMRGYAKSPADTSDEAELYRVLIPEAVLAVNPDRREGARAAKEKGATVLLMDDGFQHRKLRRDLDIVLIDATAPWGGGNTLPGGLLREPKTALKSADVVIVTRSDQANAGSVKATLAEIARLAPDAFVTTACHQPAGLRDLDGAAEDLKTLDGRNVVVLAGIARPEAFGQTLASLGAKPVAVFAKSDHHPMDKDFIRLAAAEAAKHDALVVTTEKDRAKPVFQHLCEEKADNINNDKYEGLDRIRVLAVVQKVRDMDGVIERIINIAPTS